MLLIELFDSGGNMMNRLRQAALDVITPLIGQNVPFVTVNQIIDALRNADYGIAVDRELVMQLLDPEEVKAIAEINGDRIFLSKPEGKEHEASDKEQEKEQVTKNAQQQAAKEVEQ